MNHLFAIILLTKNRILRVLICKFLIHYLASLESRPYEVGMIGVVEVVRVVKVTKVVEES